MGHLSQDVAIDGASIEVRIVDFRHLQSVAQPCCTVGEVSPTCVEGRYCTRGCCFVPSPSTRRPTDASVLERVRNLVSADVDWTPAQGLSVFADPPAANGSRIVNVFGPTGATVHYTVLVEPDGRLGELERSW